MVSVERIQPYERNPRRTANPEYDRIKDSIRRSGLDQPLVITQRPSASDYVVHSGGNTRLVILQELYTETGASQFARVPCIVKAWRDESSVVLAHLRENDLRGNLTFIDKALAVEDARKLMAEVLGVASLTQRKFTEELAKSGFRLSHQSLSLMTYAADTLHALIPVALDAGLGRHQVRRIRLLDRTGRKVWGNYCAGGDSAFESVFSTLCQRYDAPDWDNAVLQAALETEIADTSDRNLQTIRAAFDAVLNKRDVVIPDFVPIKSPPEPNANRKPADVSSNEDTPAGEQDVSVVDDVAIDIDATPTGPPNSRDERLVDDFNSTIEVENKPANDLKSLRARAWTLAARIAQRNGIGELVEPLSNNGLGYVLRDVPDKALADQLDDEGLAHLSLLWWQLAACAELTSAPLTALLSTLPTGSILRRALEEDDGDLLFKNVWTLDPGHTGYRLWRVMHDGDWTDLISLMDNYRQMRHFATQTGASIWV